MFVWAARRKRDLAKFLNFWTNIFIPIFNIVILYISNYDLCYWEQIHMFVGIDNYITLCTSLLDTTCYTIKGNPHDSLFKLCFLLTRIMWCSNVSFFVILLDIIDRNVSYLMILTKIYWLRLKLKNNHQWILTRTIFSFCWKNWLIFKNKFLSHYNF